MRADCSTNREYTYSKLKFRIHLSKRSNVRTKWLAEQIEFFIVTFSCASVVASYGVSYFSERKVSQCIGNVNEKEREKIKLHILL